MSLSEQLPVQTPPMAAPEAFSDAEAAVSRLEALYTQATRFLHDRFARTLAGERPGARVRAFYPEVRITTTSHAKADSRLSLWPCRAPGTYADHRSPGPTCSAIT